MSRDHPLVAAGRRLVYAGLAIGSLGNVSLRESDRIWITPTRVPYDKLEDDDLVAIDLHGRTLSGVRQPSSEVALHLAIYSARPDVGSIVHAHGPYGIAWSFLGVELTPPIEESRYYAIGDVQVSVPAPAASPELGAAAVEALGGNKAALLASHGTVAVGSDLDDALVVAEVVEHHARVACVLRAMAVV